MEQELQIIEKIESLPDGYKRSGKYMIQNIATGQYLIYPARREVVLTDDLSSAIWALFDVGCTDDEICAELNIPIECLIEWRTHEHVTEIAKLRGLKANVKAKKTHYDSLDKPDRAAWHLERKCKDEYSTRQEVTGKDGEAQIQVNIIDYSKVIETKA